MTDTINQQPEDSTDLGLPKGIWRIDASRSEIGFDVREMWGLRIVRGVFTAYDGTLEAQAHGATGELTIEAASLNSGHRRRDRHLRSPAFFDVERHPRIVFTTMAVRPRDGNFTVTGELTIGSSRVRLEIPAIVTQAADGTLRLDGTTRVSREAAGLAWNKLGMIRDEAVLHAHLTLTLATPRGQARATGR